MTKVGIQKPKTFDALSSKTRQRLKEAHQRSQQLADNVQKKNLSSSRSDSKLLSTKETVKLERLELVPPSTKPSLAAQRMSLQPPVNTDTDLKTDTVDLNTDTADLDTDTADLNADTADLNADTADLNTDTADTADSGIDSTTDAINVRVINHIFY